MRRLLLLLALLVLVPAAPALADYHTVLADCGDDEVLEGINSYTPADLRAALDHLPGDVAEYTNCRDVIQRALNAKTGGAGFSGTGGAPPSAGDPLATATPAERAAVEHAQRTGDRPVHLTDVAGRETPVVVHPGAIGRRVAAIGASDVPTPLLVAAILLAAATLAAAGPKLLERVRARRAT